MQVFGRPRNVPVAPPEATTHPLLLDATASGRSGGQSRTSRRPSRGQGNPTHHELLQTISELIGGPAAHLFQHMVTRGRGGGGTETIRLDVPAGALVNLERGLLQQRRPGVLSASLRVERAPRPGDPRSEGRDFDALLTLQRWAEEIKILHGKFISERASKLGNHIVLSLLPAAIEAEKRREEERLAAEAKAAEEREVAAAKEKEETKEKADKEEADRIIKEQAEAAKRETEAAESSTAMDVQDAAQESGASEPAQEADAEMGDPSSATPAPPTEGQAEETPQATGSSQETSDQAESSRAAERVTVMIHGSPVDITDTGIDPTFLEALPDEMREEVLNQHVRDQRAARVERPADSQISDEFLDALPPEIRAEIIQQERMEQARLTREAAPATNSGPPAVPADIDPASFIASLDPQLRQTVLLDSDDGFIQTLPSFMIAEAGAYREGSHAPRRPEASAPGARSAPVARKLPQPRDAIQLLDKGGVAVLVRLLFFPQVLRKNHLFKVLVHLCENAKTRTELFNLILNILQDGTGDLAAVDKSFAQLSVKSSKTPTQQTPKVAGKQKASSDYFNSLALPNMQNEANPDLVAQRCLEALTYIVSNNELSSLFFLTEHELPPGLRRTASKKGKGKERQVPQIHFPVVMLLGLLDRQSLLKTPSTMESVVSLLATVTRPLTSIKDRKLEAAPAPPESSTSETAAPVSSAPALSESADMDVEASSTAPQPTAEIPGECTQDIFRSVIS